MVKSFKGHVKASHTDDLVENSLFATPADKTALVADKGRVAQAFLFNFFGMLGMINATQPAQRQTILNFLKKDKQLRIDNIDDTNLDISLSLKLAHEAGFFTNATTVAEITRFLVKLKAGQITSIDSTVVGKWAAGLKADFITHIRDPYMRQAFSQFRADGGKTLDVSFLAVAFKARVNRVGDGGEFKSYAKRFFGLTQIQPGAVAAPPVAQPTVATPAQPTAAPAKLSYYQRQKLKKQQAAGQAPAAPVAASPTQAAPAKLSYYQKQKLKKQQATDAANAIAKAAAQAAADAAALKAKEEEENRKAQAAAVKAVPADHLNQMIDKVISGGSFDKYVYYSDKHSVLQKMFGFTIVPDLYVNTVNQIMVIASSMNFIANQGDAFSFIQEANKIKTALKEIEKLTGHTVTMLDVIKKVLANGGTSSYAVGSYAGRYIAAMLLTDQVIDQKLFSETIAKLNSDGLRSLIFFVRDNKPIVADIAKIVAASDDLMKSYSLRDMPVYAVMRLGKNWGTPVKYTYQHTYDGYEVLGIAIIRAYKGPFKEIIDHVIAGSGTYGLSYLDDSFVGFGVDSTDLVIDGGIAHDLRLRFKEFFDTAFRSGYAELKRRVFRNMYSQFKYDSSLSNGGGPLPQAIHEEFAADMINVGWKESKLAKLTLIPITDYSVKGIMKAIGVDLGELIQKHPNDPASVYLNAVTNGLKTVTTDQLAAVILSDPQATSAGSLFRSANNIVSNAYGDRDDNCEAIAKAMLKVAQGQPKTFNSQIAGTELLKTLPYASGETVQGWLKLAKDNNIKWIMGVDLYKDLHKSNKQGYVDILTGIVQDCIGSPVEDFVNDIVDELPPHVVQKMRGNLVGGSVLIDEIQKGEIKPFDKIDAVRLKKIFLYNDIDMSQILSGTLSKKSKSESYTQYFARAKQATQGKSMLGLAKVTPDPKADAKAINRIMIQRDHAGKHGDTYPKIDKVYDANVEFPEFWAFRQKKPKDGSIVPAYHGTGGIAASMILRYGFKVIKSTDPSVVGRMLGDGIYFSNKIDKVSQYVSNGGYSRQHGQKGYVMEMDTNLGTRNVDYRAAGVDGRDNIRSPEWCVVDPKAQLRIVRVYEVTLVSKSSVDRHLAESVQSSGLKGFRQHLKEQVMQDLGNTTSFVFRDGLIPIVDLDTKAVTYVDFEDALKKKLIKDDMFDTSAQGPVIVFRNTKDQVVIDERFAEHMGGDDLQLYIEYFVENMKS